MTQSLESPSGLGRYWPLSKELVRLGHEVTILALHHDFHAVDQRCFTRDGVQVHYVGQMHVHKTGNRKEYFSPTHLIWITTLGTWRLTQAALQVPADVIHLAKPHPMNGMAGLAACRLRGKYLYLDCDDYEAESNYFNGKWQQQGVIFFEDRLPLQAHGVTTNTYFMAQRLQGLGVSTERIVYIPNGVDRTRFSRPDLERVATLRTELGLNGHPVVCYLGSLSLASHAVDLLVEAFVLLSQWVPEVRLLLVGGGEAYESLQQQAQAAGVGERTVFVGRVAPERVIDYYHLANVSVDPARDDLAVRARSPLKLFESWAAGIPFVTADVGDRRELLGDPPAGLLAVPGDAESLAAAISEVLQNPDLANTLKCRGQERVRSFYWEQLVKDFVRVYQDA